MSPIEPHIRCPKCGNERILVTRNGKSTGICGQCGFRQDGAYTRWPWVGNPPEHIQEAMGRSRWKEPAK